MPKVSFNINLEKDIENIYDKCTLGVPYGKNWNIDPNLKKICEGKTIEEVRKELENYLGKIYDSPYLEAFRKSSENLWNKIEKEFFERMDYLMKNKYSKDIKSYITTISICPYDPDEPFFMISLTTPLQVAMMVCGHEIMHLYFHEFYWDTIEKQIGEKKTGDLKEALTVILNLEFKDLWLIDDNGYEEHKELREFISKSWKEEKDFDKLLGKCVNYLNLN